MNLGSAVFACTEIPKIEAVTTWEIFRKTFPFHIQTLGFDKRSSILVISEPPPLVTIEKLKETAPELGPIEVKQHPMGCDGWVKDLVIQLPQMTDLQRQDLFDRINLYLFHTTYKASVLDLPFTKSTLDNENTPLDVTVTFADLKDWFFDKNEIFESVLTGDQIAFNSIFSSKKTGVYISKEPGLVIWAIDRKKPLDDNLAEARQFALDSDLIVGSVSNTEMLTIVGRARILPLDVFPPLRTETILQLAAIKIPDLGQSYERNYVFAGRFTEKDDWAPIYLSDELIDTEYGSLLNITDQILKRWSMKGTVNYKNFESYADPKGFPFKDKTLVEYLNKPPEVTFNWNTLGLGYSSDINGKHIFAVNRTGALPTSYLSEDQNNFSEAEVIGYDYFASVGDPNLTRVVQYATLYQIFQDSKITVGKDVFSFEKHKPNYEELYRELVKITDEIKEIPLAEVELLQGSTDTIELADAIRKVKAFSNKSEFEATARSILEPRNLNSQFNKRIDAYYREYNQLQNAIKLLESSINSNNSKIIQTSESARAKFNEFNSKCPGVPKGTGLPQDIECYKLVTEARRLENEPSRLNNINDGLIANIYRKQGQISNLGYAFGVFVDFNKALGKASKEFVTPSEANRLKDIYLRSVPERTSKWIHTPSIVVSSNNDFRSIGGHNLDSKVTSFRSGRVVPGKVQIIKEAGKQVIITNPSDLGKMSSLVRTAAINNKSGDVAALKASLEQKLVSQKAILPKSKPVALEYPSQKLSPFKIEKIGWFPGDRVLAFEDDVITIAKREDGGETITYRNREVTAYSPTSRNDYLSSIKYGGKEPVRIRMKGYELDEVRALKSSMSIKETSVEPSLIKMIKDRTGKTLAKDFDFANAKIHEPQFEVIGGGNNAYTKVSVDIEVLPSLPAKSGLLLRVENHFKGLVTKLRQQQLVLRVRKLFGSKFLESQIAPEAEVNPILSEIQNELRSEFPDIKDIRVYLYDLTVSENLRTYENDDAYAE